MGKPWVLNFLLPFTPQDGVKLFTSSLLKDGNLLCSPSLWRKLQAPVFKTTAKCFVELHPIVIIIVIIIIIEELFKGDFKCLCL